MADEIVVKYQADISNLQSNLNKVESELLSVEKDSKTAMTVLAKESNKAATSVDKVDKQVNTLGSSLSGLLNKLPFAGAIQEVNEFGGAIKGVGVSASQASKGVGLLKTAFTSLGIGVLVAAFVSLVAYVKSTEDGGDRLAKIMKVIGAIVGEVTKVISVFGGILFDAGEAMFDYVGGADSAKKSTDDYSKSVTDLASEIADLEDKIGALTITIELQNEKLQTAIELNLRKLRNQNILFKESIQVIDKIGDLEEKRLINSTSLIDEKIKLERKDFLLKTRENVDAFKRLEEAQHLEKGLLKEQAGWRRDMQLDIARNIIKENSEFINQIKQKGKLFDQFIRGEINAGQLLDKAKGTFQESDASRIAELLKQREEANRQSLNLEERLQNFKDAAANKEKARQEKLKQEADKEFQERLKNISNEEKLALERANIEGKAQDEIITIQEQFNIKRIALLRQYNKTNEFEYKELLLKSMALEKAYSAFLVSEENKRLEEIKKHRELILSETDKTFKEEQNLAKANSLEQFEQLARSYKEGLITREKFEEESAKITLDIQKQSIKDEIDLIEQKLIIVEDDINKRTDLEGQLLDKKKALYDLDLNAFKKIEDDKTKKQQEEAHKRKELIKQASNEAFNISSQLSNGFNDLELARTTTQIQNEQAANEQKTNDLIANLQKRKDAGLITEAQFNAQKALLDKQKAQKDSELKKKQFQAEQRAAINKISIDEAVAIIKTFAQYGFTPVGAIAAGGIAAAAEIEKAFIRAQPVPKFKDGVIGLRGPGTETSDSIPAMLSKNESVIKAKQSMKYSGVLTAINDDYFDKYVHQNYIVPALKKQEHDKRRLAERQAGTADNLMKALEINGFGDMSHLERLTKSNKNVRVDNLGHLPAEIGKEVSRAISNNNYIK